MWMLVILSYLAVAIMDGGPLLKSRDWKKVIVYLALMAFACFVGVKNGGDHMLPSPAVPIKNLILAIIGH